MNISFKNGIEHVEQPCVTAQTTGSGVMKTGPLVDVSETQYELTSV